MSLKQIYPAGTKKALFAFLLDDAKFERASQSSQGAIKGSCQAQTE